MPAYLAGDTLPADDLNRMGCRLRRAANQTIVDAATTALSWDTEDIDTDGLFAIGTPTIITVPINSLWTVTVGVVRAAAVNARSFIEIVPSTGPWAAAGGSIRIPMGTGEAAVGGGGTFYLTAGSTISVNAFFDGAANSTMTGAIEVWRAVGGAA